MRFTRLALAPYGAFENLTLQFDGAARLHLVFGTNGAGKSTSLDALRSVLYGFGERGGNFRFEHGSLRLGARLLRSDGSALEFVRRKAKKSPLWDVSDTEPLAEELLAPFLGNVDRDQFTNIFGLDLATMEAGGKALLQGEGEVGRALFGAGLGGERLAKVVTRLDDETKALYVERGKNALIQRLRSEHEELEKEIRRASLSASAFDRERRELQTARRERSVQKEEREALRTERKRLLVLQRALAGLAPLAAKERELAELASQDGPERAALDTEALDTEALVELQDLHERWRAAAASARERATRLARHDEDAARAATACAPTVLAHADEIDSVNERLDAYRSARTATPKARSELEAALAERREALTRLRLAAVDGDDAAASLRALAGLDGTTERALRATETHLTRTQKAEQTLDATLPEVRRAEEQLARSVACVQGLDESLTLQFRAALEELAPFRGTPSELAALALPTAERAAELAGVLDAARERFTEAARRLATSEVGVQSARAELNELARSERSLPPSRAEVERARSERDALLLRAFDDAPRPSTSVSASAAVRRADDLVDGLIEDSERAAARLSAEQRIERADAELQLAEARHLGTTAELEAARVAWAELFADVGLGALMPLDMKAWRERRRQLLARIDEARARARTDVERAEAELASRRSALATAHEAVGAARAEWAAYSAAQGLASDVDPTAAREHLRALDQLANAVAKVADSELRLVAHVALTEGFVRDVRMLAQGVGVEPSSEAVERASREAGDVADVLVIEGARALVTSLARARVAQTAAAAIERQRELEREAERRAEAEIAVMKARLDEFQRRTGTDSLEACLAHAERAERRRRLVRERDTLLRDFDEHAGARDPDTARAAIGERSAAELQAEIDVVEEQLRACEERFGEWSEKIAVLQQTVEGQGNDEASVREERLATIEAELEDAARAYLVGLLAQQLLNREVECYRQEAQGPLLTRAQSLFETLTGGAYTQLHPSEDERGKTIMVARRLDGTSVKVEGMSTGTQNQLYLALRIASVEHMLERAEPMPFVADDLFVNFDDERTEAALAVLAELGERTQVIVFTHHERVVEAAMRLGVAVDVIRLQGERDRTAVP